MRTAGKSKESTKAGACMCVYLPYITVPPHNCCCNHTILYAAQELMTVVLLEHNAAEGEYSAQK
jgi:hypothetical protein